MSVYAALRSVSVRVRVWLGYALMNLVTFPYYRFFRQNTLMPIKTIVKAYEHGAESDESHRMFMAWQDRKLIELHFVQVAATLLAGAVIGCFSWVTRDAEHWLGPASWYCSLILSLFAILLSSTEAFIFNTMKSSSRPVPLRDRLSLICSMPNHGDDDKIMAAPRSRRRAVVVDKEKGTLPLPLPLPLLRGDRRGGGEGEGEEGRVQIRWNMVFTWQAPTMLLAYAVISFLTGVTIYITTPLYSDDTSLGGKPAAIYYLSGLFAGGAVFIWCSYWAYRFVDLDRP
ncbi:hypothetical protein F4802DRAFT_130530 [Xylaria palmicola]|nr:hypothetical protein F4802DRAFT_130530 [Xylaria palmicola]